MVEKLSPKMQHLGLKNPILKNPKNKIKILSNSNLFYWKFVTVDRKVAAFVGKLQFPIRLLF